MTTSPLRQAIPLPAPRAPEALMTPARLAAIQPSRLSVSRSFLARALRERWNIRRVHFTLDDKARGTAMYRAESPHGVFDFPVYSFEVGPQGRTGRIIGRRWDMMGALIDGVASADDIERTAVQLPRLYTGRATPNTLIWARSNRSSRAFDHTVEALAAGRQPDLSIVGEVCYVMRNTGLDGNGTFGTRSYPSIGAGHPLGAPLAAQMLCGYLMRTFAIDLVHHLARARNPRAARLSPEIQRFLGIGNGSALGLILFVNNHPQLVHKWLLAREQSIAAAKALPAGPGSPVLKRLLALLDRAIIFRREDRMVYERFVSSATVATELGAMRSAVERLHDGAAAPGDPYPLARLADRFESTVSPEAHESLLSLLIELVPDTADALAAGLAADEEVGLSPAMNTGELRGIVQAEYRWALAMDLDRPGASRYVWYKSETAEEPRRGPREEVGGAHNLGLDLPRLIQQLDAALAAAAARESVARILMRNPGLRSVVARVQTLRGLAYHSPHMNIMDEDFVPIDMVRFMNVGIHGIDKTRDYLGRNLRGVLLHGAPTPEDLAAGATADWFFPPEPCA